MSDYRIVLQEIGRLEAIVSSELGESKWNFEAIWSQIRITGSAFKGARFPTKEEHQKAWEDFQKLIHKVKEKQESKNDKVLKEIQNLKAMIPVGLIGEEKWDFEAIWSQIRITGSAFKGARFPTKEEHQKTWEDFQSHIDKVKKKQEDNRKQSSALRDSIIRQANCISLTDDRWVAALFTAGISLVIDKVVDGLVEVIDGKERPPYEAQREILESANKELKNLWDLFGKKKAQLLRDDKDAVYRTLMNVQSRLDDEWGKFKKLQAEISAKSRDKIVGMATAAIPPTSFVKEIEVAISAFLTKGLSLLLEFCDSQESELQACNKKLKEAWNCFNNERIYLLRHDKNAAYHALKEAEAKLNAAWTEFKKRKQEAKDQYYKNKRQQGQVWRSNVQQNLEKNRQQYSKLEGVLEHKRQNLENNRQRHSKLEEEVEHKYTHLNELHEKQNDARNDSYRERVEGWIEEESKKIQNIKEKLTDIDDWIRKDSDSIQDIEKKLMDVNDWIREDESKLNS